VVAAGRACAGEQFQVAVDTELAAYWSTVILDAEAREGADRTSGLLIRAGLAAVPYLMRLGALPEATAALQQAFFRDPSRTNAAVVLPAIQAIAATGQDVKSVGVLARILRLIDPGAAERQMRAYLDAAVDNGDYLSAWAATHEVIIHCRDSGRLAEAFALSDKEIDYARRAGLGPWSQLLSEVHRLRVLILLGHSEYVLAEVRRLREHMETLPVRSQQPELAIPWDTREALLNVGLSAAINLGLWTDALELSAPLVASRADRGAPATEMARARFNDHLPLKRLGRFDEALALLRQCRQVFDDAHDIQGLGFTLSALADLEDERGHGDVAIDLQRDALRYEYLAGNVMGIAVSYDHLGGYLRRHAHQPAAALAHHLAAALIRALAGAGGTDEAVRATASDLRALGNDGTIPADVADLCRHVFDASGADLERLLAKIAPDPGVALQKLQELLTRVRELAATLPSPSPAS
jgi:tetratricopeptide (TPR) repeat protein